MWAGAAGFGISIHSPLAGRDHRGRKGQKGRREFQSTRPSRGETKATTCARRLHSRFQSTRPSRGETLKYDRTDAVNTLFQSTRPSRGETPPGRMLSFSLPLFQSTRPSRGETPAPPMPAAPQAISIHSPLAGRDDPPAAAPPPSVHFNPLAPRGARLTLTRIQVFL